MKKLLSIVLCIVLMLALCSCKNSYVYNCEPHHQTGTYWVSNDGNMSFYVHDYDRVLGELIIGEEEIEVQFWWSYLSPPMEIYSIDYLTDNTEPYEHETEYYLLEKWTSYIISKDIFIAVVKESTYFEEGDVFVFKKTDVGDNEIVYPPKKSASETVE